MTHGTLTGYTTHGCRCDPCRQAMRAYHQSRKVEVDREALRDVLLEMFPLGLTDDCPARQAA